jgi:translation initiation factor 1
VADEAAEFLKSMKPDRKITTDGGAALGQNPFSALNGLNLPDALSSNSPSRNPAPNAADKKDIPPQKNRGRVDVTREKNGRGGKTVTVVSGFVGIGLPEKEQLAKKMQKACGVGGTVKDGRIEIQGDKRDEVARILTEAGFRAVFAGG